jgi:hypothetical protein
MAQTFGIEFKVIKPLDTKAIDNYMDKCVMGIARATLDFTNTGHHFPYLTGELNRASMAEGVIKEADKTYHLGARGVDYAPKVWNYPQSTHWTNPNTYAQWYMTEYQRDENVIVESAIKQVKGTLK